MGGFLLGRQTPYSKLLNRTTFAGRTELIEVFQGLKAAPRSADFNEKCPPVEGEGHSCPSIG